MKHPTLIRLSIHGPDGRLATACDLTVHPWHHGNGRWGLWLTQVAPEWLARTQASPEGDHVATAHGVVGEDKELSELARVTLTDAQVKKAAVEREREVREDIARQLAADSAVCACYPNPADHEDGCPKRANEAVDPDAPPEVEVRYSDGATVRLADWTVKLTGPRRLNVEGRLVSGTTWPRDGNVVHLARLGIPGRGLLADIQAAIHLTEVGDGTRMQINVITDVGDPKETL